MKNILLLFIILCTSCSSAPEKNHSQNIPQPKIRCMILIDEVNASKIYKAGNNYSEEYTASLLPDTFTNSGKDTARKFAQKTAINVSESFNGILDPVIKDYLISELRIDIVILGKIVMNTDGDTEILLKAVNLSNDNTISFSEQNIKSPNDFNIKKRLEHSLKTVINMNDNIFFKNIERHFENRRQK
ncbi:MAG: hypothetical protein KAZ87_04080 [Spirochaetes bacterium]|nr:hypothetical protein [Spirochaetota bacterium]